ncbi:hypothetical protein MKW92_032827, partial [Papaver armeniacum]
QLAVERVMNRDRKRILRQNMTEEQRSIVREHDRIRHRATKEKLNLPSASTGNMLHTCLNVLHNMCRQKFKAIWN